MRYAHVPKPAVVAATLPIQTSDESEVCISSKQVCRMIHTLCDVLLLESNLDALITVTFAHALTPLAPLQQEFSMCFQAVSMRVDDVNASKDITLPCHFGTECPTDRMTALAKRQPNANKGDHYSGYSAQATCRCACDIIVAVYEE